MAQASANDSPLRILTDSLARAEPLKMADYLTAGGGAALAKAISLGPEGVRDLISGSGLVCRDGRGSLARLMQASGAAGAPVVICHAHRPLAGRLDQLVLEGCPHGVIEGASIAAFALGASRVVLAITADLGSAVARSILALEDCRKVDLLGDGVLGSEFSLSVSVRKMAGRPPDSDEALVREVAPDADAALITSAETFLHLRSLVLHGPEALASLGVGDEVGTKLLVCEAEGSESVCEVPMGTDLAGWLRDRTLAAGEQAFHVGQPLGRLMRPQDESCPLSAAFIVELGSAVDAGHVAALGARVCIVQRVHEALRLARDGASPCYGPGALVYEHLDRLLTRIRRGEADRRDLDRLHDLAAGAAELGLDAATAAGLGLLLSGLDRFGGDFETHALLARCGAAVCECVSEAPCSHACPIGINCAQFIGLMSKKAVHRAADIIRRRNPFPSVCGRVCHKPCEALCVLWPDGHPIAIRELERAAADGDRRKRPPVVRWREATGRKVAVVGGGPAGLTAGYFLSVMGHQVTVYDRGPTLGGALASALPAHLLAPASLDRDVARIARRLRVRLDAGVLTKQRLAQIVRRSDAVVIAAGMAYPAPASIPGADAEGVVDGLSFLGQCRQGGTAPHGHVVVVGRGSSAGQVSFG